MRGNGSVPLICARCGAAFSVPAYRVQSAHYCGRACADLGRRGQPSERDQRVTLHCEACGAAFKYQAGKAAGRRFCSRACAKGQKRRIGERPRDPSKREMRTCPTCRSHFEVWTASERRYCSQACYFTSRRSGTPATFWATVSDSGVLPAACPELGAHRLAWELIYGPIPDTIWVLHQCDVRLCCNPAHLYLGTGTDNSNDMWRRGRHPRTAKLTPELVRRIKREGIVPGVQTELAAEFGVSLSCVSDVVHGRTWKHIT